MAPKVSASLSAFIQPDTEEEVVGLPSNIHSRNAFPASGKRVAGRGRDLRDIVPAARINSVSRGYQHT